MYHFICTTIIDSYGKKAFAWTAKTTKKPAKTRRMAIAHKNREGLGTLTKTKPSTRRGGGGGGSSFN